MPPSPPHPADSRARPGTSRGALRRWILGVLALAFLLNTLSIVLIAIYTNQSDWHPPNAPPNRASGALTRACPPGPGLRWVYAPPKHLGGLEHVLVFPTDGSGLRPHRDKPALHWMMPILRQRPGPDQIVRSGAGPPTEVTLVGWPVYAAECARRPGGSVSWGIPIDWNSAIPLRPILAGVVLNTAAFTPVAYVMLLVARVVQRALDAFDNFARPIPGRCVSRRCRYQVGDLPICPECGTVQPRTPPPADPSTP